MAGQITTRRIVRLNERPTSLSGITLEETDITRVDIVVQRTLPAYRATEIQHDVEEYRRRNMEIFNKLENDDPYHHPKVEDVATPIYLIARIYEGPGEIVYVGKAESKKNRFEGGHIALLRLLDPEYKDHDKFISFAIINITTSNKQIVPVEWVYDKQLRTKLISHIEHALVWKFQPCYNTHFKASEPQDFSFEINFWDASDGDLLAIKDVRVRAAHGPIAQLTPEVLRGAIADAVDGA
ncbi:hypothetical protein RZN05_19605 [Sphingomonas sp. HF-S4]|uniref:GIY-YIG domain-containing protein n=1 Tax=Sphingomonas agrestis TaxID=3080540 RepID=A0ABU3YD62_9SPHN|nr:hypothetical protein [Sphingomonas sp. HF-S4]MDV3459212.1 hypothetical protein [Sphingomonas sp. HF-S4]